MSDIKLQCGATAHYKGTDDYQRPVYVASLDGQETKMVCVNFDGAKLCKVRPDGAPGKMFPQKYQRFDMATALEDFAADLYDKTVSDMFSEPDSEISEWKYDPMNYPVDLSHLFEESDQKQSAWLIYRAGVLMTAWWQSAQ